MDELTLQEREKLLRLAGQKLDSLWMEARHATGQKRADLHHRIGSLREEQTANRKEHELLSDNERRSKQSNNPLPLAL